jgi:hypothetical protein
VSTPSAPSVHGPTVKALTLWQPWATFMALGAKRNETRGWSTSHRGSLAIHASSRTAGWGRRGTRTMVGPYEVEKDGGGLLLRGPGLAWPYRLPLGVVVAIVDIIDVKRTTSMELRPSELEASLGNYDSGRYAWQTGSLRIVPTSWHGRTRVAGHQGLWDWQMPEGLREQLPYPLRAAS